MTGKSENEIVNLKLDRALEKIQTVDERVEKMNLKMEKICEESLPEIRVDIANLKTKASIWGGVSGMIMAVILSGGIDLVIRLFGH